MQITSVTGLWGIVFLMGWFASVVNWAWQNNWSWSRVKRGVLLYAALFTFVMGYDTIRLISAGAPSESLRVAAIPSNQDFIATLSKSYPDLSEAIKLPDNDRLLAERYLAVSLLLLSFV